MCDDGIDPALYDTAIGEYFGSTQRARHSSSATAAVQLVHKGDPMTELCRTFAEFGMAPLGRKNHMRNNNATAARFSCH